MSGTAPLYLGGGRFQAVAEWLVATKTKSKAKKPEIDLQVRPPLINFIFLRKHFLMWGGGGSAIIPGGRGGNVTLCPPPPMEALRHEHRCVLVEVKGKAICILNGLADATRHHGGTERVDQNSGLVDFIQAKGREGQQIAVGQ